MPSLPIGVCTWSLANPDLAQTLATIKNDLRLNVVHLGFMDDSYKEPNKLIDTVQESGLQVSASCVGFEGEDYSTIQQIAMTGGYMPDDRVDERIAKTIAAADINAKLGVKLLSTHIGFVPSAPNDYRYITMVDRVRKVSDALGERGIMLVMETGQESPDEMLEFIDNVDRENLGVNFDPANMILYGSGQPAEAVDALQDWIVHVHMKDATWSDEPKVKWGEEVVLGTGQADIPQIIRKLQAQGYNGTLAIEREAGNQRVTDIAEAITLLETIV